MSGEEFHNDMMRLVSQFGGIIRNMGVNIHNLDIGYMKKDEFKYEVAIIGGPFGEPIFVATVYLDKATDTVCYCLGRQYSPGEKVIN